jgi:hypothetical protein
MSAVKRSMKQDVAYGVCEALVRMEDAREACGDDKGRIYERDLPRIIEWARAVVK